MNKKHIGTSRARNIGQELLQAAHEMKAGCRGRGRKVVKRSQETDDVYMALMRDAVKAIKSYTRGGAKKFYKDQLVQDAVIYRLGLLGEAASRVSARTRKVLNDVPWKIVIQNRQFPLHPSTPASLRQAWKSVTNLVPRAQHVLDLHGREST